mmetsp:Transcript_17978/g.49924  ORF Transcript_17978/g.49924 Transcript_17978/m.49924 type:complete len:282 (+) Transcript_17978:22-867(+)
MVSRTTPRTGAACAGAQARTAPEAGALGEGFEELEEVRIDDLGRLVHRAVPQQGELLKSLHRLQVPVQLAPGLHGLPGVRGAPANPHSGAALVPAQTSELVLDQRSCRVGYEIHEDARGVRGAQARLQDAIDELVVDGFRLGRVDDAQDGLHRLRLGHGAEEPVTQRCFPEHPLHGRHEGLLPGGLVLDVQHAQGRVQQECCLHQVWEFHGQLQTHAAADAVRDHERALVPLPRPHSTHLLQKGGLLLGPHVDVVEPLGHRGVQGQRQGGAGVWLGGEAVA